MLPFKAILSTQLQVTATQLIMIITGAAWCISQGKLMRLWLRKKQVAKVLGAERAPMFSGNFPISHIVVFGHFCATSCWLHVWPRDTFIDSESCFSMSFPHVVCFREKFMTRSFHHNERSFLRFVTWKLAWKRTMQDSAQVWSHLFKTKPKDKMFCGNCQAVRFVCCKLFHLKIPGLFSPMWM